MPDSSQKHASPICGSGQKPGKTEISPTCTLIVGCGYLGFRVGQADHAAGHQVYATTRHRDRADRLSAHGFHARVIDWTDRPALHDLVANDLPPMDQILVAVSYDRNSRCDRYDSQVGGLRNLLDALKIQQGNHGHLCYISTTGVYHQTDGRWVDETSPTHANREGGRVHLQAETMLRRHKGVDRSTVLRLAGIYGPGRVPRAADVIAGRPIHSPAAGYLNLIHVDDAAAAVMAVWRRVRLRESLQPLYVVADDQPVVRQEFYREIAHQCGASDPRFIAPRADAPVSVRSETNKRIWNRRMKRDLLPRLRYPTYREGLADVLRGSLKRP